MKRTSSRFIGVSTYFFAVFLFLSGYLINTSKAGEPAQYLVKFKNHTSFTANTDLLNKNSLNIQKAFPEINLFAVDASPEAVQNQMDQLTEYGSLEALQESLDIEYIEENQFWYAVPPEPTVSFKKRFNPFKNLLDPLGSFESEDAPETASDGPNDELYKNQNGMRRLVGSQGQDRLGTTWNQTIGAYNVIVAVSDTGMDQNHPDLKNQLWTNPNEIPDNGIDDDQNGFVDDVHGWNFSKKNNNPFDDEKHGHGTHVSGIIGAEGNNKVGITGVNWKVSILPVKYLDGNGRGSTQKGVETILYAANMGARVVNASWGGASKSQALTDAIEYALNKGTLVVAAAGNSSTDTDKMAHYPSGSPSLGVIAVASSASDGSLSNFSNWGETTVDIAAPGSGILSTVPNANWKQLSGTSMASPMVAGVAGLILSVKPELSVLDLRNAILNAVEERSGYRGKVATSGDLSATKAIQQLSEGFQIWPSRLTVASGSSYQFTAYSPQGNVTWKTTNPSIATINQTGTLQAVSQGSTQVIAQDESGATVQTRWIEITTEKKPRSGGIPMGCFKRKNELSFYESVNAAINFALPFIFFLGFFGFRRRKNV